jgi:hypothetical protein
MFFQRVSLRVYVLVAVLIRRTVVSDMKNAGLKGKRMYYKQQEVYIYEAANGDFAV